MNKTKFLIGLFGLFLITTAVGGVLLIQAQKRGLPIPPSDPPEVRSSIRGIELVTSSVEHAGKPEALASVYARNVSGKAIIAVMLCSGDEKGFAGIINQNFQPGDTPPGIVYDADDEFTMSMPMASLMKSSVRLCAVVYADGSEEGEKIGLERIRASQKHYRSLPSKEVKNLQ